MGGGGGSHLHGDVGDGGGRQVKVLLNQDVEFGGQVAAGPNTVHLAGEQGRDLRGMGGRSEVMGWGQLTHYQNVTAENPPPSLAGQTRVCLLPAGKCGPGPGRTAGSPLVLTRTTETKYGRPVNNY